jgi:hypothetical protein
MKPNYRFATKRRQDMIKGGYKEYSGEVPILEYFTSTYNNRPVELEGVIPFTTPDMVYVTYLDSAQHEPVELELVSFQELTELKPA